MESVTSEKLVQNDKKMEIYIRCPNTMQNQLLVEYLGRGTGYPVTCGTQFSAKTKGKNIHFLFLFDCFNLKEAGIWPSIGSDSFSYEGNIATALFNVAGNLSATIEPIAIARGISGIFYEGLSLDILVKGLQAILNGELWYSHKAISRYIKQNAARTLVRQDQNEPLTPREKEILRFLITGESNTDIADKLHLSIHTIKTHIYNLYKKIDVPNRLQAVLWAAKHLPYI